MSAIERAITYANDKEHEGAGYTLWVSTVDGLTVEVDVYGAGPSSRLLRLRGEHDGEAVFFDPRNITRVRVEF